ncbi:caspase family protein [Flavilitoribacter nigricans]|uniref:Peptidase C14 caspase domain-containing protein n=1 Tax=Flavilitoribacter nigricans (strain ATCC 23147 / DSM 23189 / NBRC 102662 / NCIMB 1420 / SS-2) TaxID=1122177 RepID=A0A2D0NHG8_FLAN2|nr:caspase family protein [Flavilitoribacter nigricans]PHN07830.1 hypothetical protein CRP01_03510 [Flavilitoribacter nigricans DSM 23189 = NBRC 102662]
MMKLRPYSVKKVFFLVVNVFPLLLAAQQARLYFPQKLSEGIHEVDISANGTVISTFMNNEFRFWDVATGKLISNFPLPTDYVFSRGFGSYCEMMPDGSGIIYTSVGLDNYPQIQFWDRDKQKRGVLTTAPRGYFSADGNFLFTKEYDPGGTGDLYDYQIKCYPIAEREGPEESQLFVHEKAELFPLPIHPLQVLIVESDQEDILDPEFQYSLSLIDFKKSEKSTFTPVFTHKPIVVDLMTTQPIAVLNTGEAEQAHLKLFNYEQGKFGRDLGPYPGVPVCTTLSPDERYLYALLDNGQIVQQDLTTGRPPELLIEVDLYLYSGPDIEIFSPVLKNTSGGLIGLFKSGEHQLEAWNIDRGQKIWEQAVTTVQENYDDQLDQILPFRAPGREPAVLIADRQGNILVRDLQSGRITQSFEYGYPVEPREAGLDPDGKLRIRADGKQWSFDLPSGRLTPLPAPSDNSTLQHQFALPDGRRIDLKINGFDYSIQLVDQSQDQLLAKLYLLNDREWVIIKPDGLFDASPGAMNLLYYVVDLEIIELDQLKGRYFEPGLLQKLLGYSPERLRSVEGMNQLMLYPKLSAQIEGEQLQVQLTERNGGIGPVSVFVNGKEVERDVNPDRKTAFSYNLSGTHHLLLRHPDSTNIVSLRAFNEAGWLKGPSVELVYRPAARAKGNGSGAENSWEASLDPKMYVVSIGTSDYNGDQLDLQFAAQDALAMAKALQSVGANLFANGDSIEVHCLSTVPATETGLEATPIHWQFASKANIESTLKDIRRRAKAEDVLLVYLSGHGLTYGASEAAQFYYLTHDVNSEDMLSDPDARARYTVSTEELTAWLKDIAALKQVLIIDACNSGKVIDNLTSTTRSLNSSQIRALDRMKDRTGTFILSGSAADKVSYEASEYGQGLLTYALLQGMLGVATRNTADGDYVDVMKLFQYAADEVPRLATSINGIQSPMLGFPSTGASFDIGIFDERVDISIGNKKPVVNWIRFLNRETITDDQGIEVRLREKLARETEKGKDADLLFVEINNYPNGYTLNGLYSVDARGIIHTDIRLIRGNEPPIILEVEATDDVERLVQYIFRKVKPMLHQE